MKEPRELLALVNAAKNDDPEALGTLCDRFFPQVYRFMVRRVATRENAEILAGKTCARMVKSLPGQHGFFPEWLFCIARETLTDYNHRHRPVWIGANSHVDSRLFFDQDLEGALARLTLKQEETTWLRFVEGYAVAEIGQILGRTPEVVRSLQFHAVSTLCDELFGRHISGYRENSTTVPMDEIVDVCLDRLFAGKCVEGCLMGYPELHSELMILLRVGERLRDALRHEPRAAAVRGALISAGRAVHTRGVRSRAQNVDLGIFRRLRLSRRAGAQPTFTTLSNGPWKT